MSDSKEMRLPGSVAEIQASPPGPQIGAFFDLDGTLVAGFTGVILAQEQFINRQMGVGDLIGMIEGGINHKLGRLEFEGLIRRATQLMRGRPLLDLDEIGERLFNHRIKSRVYPEMRELVRAHLDRGHTVCLSSSALTVQVDPVARYLNIPNTLTNVFEVDDNGLLTGDVVEPILWGSGKANAVQKFAAEHGIDLKDSYFYADGDEDVALMYLVGNPRPTNPESKMEALAKQRGWPILKFNSRSGTGLSGLVRNLAGVSTLGPVAAGAVGWGLLHRSRRRGVNFFTRNFFSLLFAINGVSVEVIGRENLTKKRPAVFIFNHRNNFDPMITASLIGENVTGVGKKELASDPLLGPVGKLLDGVFIDREDTAAAVETLQQVEDMVAKGISIVMAPEGTRHDTTEVGPFKKGPFRLAMAAGVPIVPVVIRNADAIAARDSATMNPGKVDVVVYPPVSVADWTHDNLVEHIDGIRRLYLDTLKNWPDGAVPDITPYLDVPTAPVTPTPAKKTPANKTPAKKATPAAKKVPAKKAAKQAVKKVPTKKTAAKKPTSRAEGGTTS